MHHKIKLPQMAWFGDTEKEISLPEDWQVSVYHIPVDALPIFSPQQIREAIKNPIGCPHLSELARGKKEIVIIVDDISRPTPVADIFPFILKELESAGIPDKSIRIIVALGAHGAHTRVEFEKKLSSEVIRRFPVYNHNSYENTTRVGITSRGTTLDINSEVMACDLKVAIGSILPHPSNGFGGGGKMILPGVASITSIQANHMLAGVNPKSTANGLVGLLGEFEKNERRKDVEEAASMVGLDFIANALLNTRRKIVGLVAGHHVMAHHEGVQKARNLYATPRMTNMDMIISNANAKASEAAIAMILALPCLKESGGDLVLVINSPIGQLTHYLHGAFGNNIGGRFWFPRTNVPNRLNRLIILTDYPDYASGQWFGTSESITWSSSWEETVGLLRKKYGPGAKVGIIIDGTMQFFRDDV